VISTIKHYSLKPVTFPADLAQNRWFAQENEQPLSPRLLSPRWRSRKASSAGKRERQGEA